MSIGALGGLVAIVVGGMMEKFGVPIGVAVGFGCCLRSARWLACQRRADRRTGINGFIITLATASVFTGINLGVTKSIPFYNMPPAFVAFGTARFFAVPYLLIPPVIVGGVARGFLRPHRSLADICSRSAATRRRPSFPAFRETASSYLAHALSGLLAAIGAHPRRGSTRVGAADHWLGLVDHLLRRADHRRRGADAAAISRSPRHALAVVLIALIQNGMVLAKVDPYWVQFLLGALILAAVGLNRLRAVLTGTG